MQENQSIAISCRGVHKHFGDGTRVQALRGVDFEARLGELTFIVGPSGCGKTTLLSVITGLLDPSDGEVELFGSSAGRLPANQRILFRRVNVGFVFQQFNLLPTLTAAENAAVPLIAAGMKRTEAVERAKALLDQPRLVNQSPRDRHAVWRRAATRGDRAGSGSRAAAG